MGEKFYSIITDAGTKKFMNAMVNGEKVKIENFAVGDGAGNYYEPCRDMERLKGEVWRGKISDYFIEGDRLTVNAVLPGETGGFIVREMGLIDEDGTLIAVCNTPECQKEKSEFGIVNEIDMCIEIILNNTELLEISLDSDIVYAKKRDIEKLREELDNIKFEQMGRGNKKTVFNADGTITESYNNRKIVTIFNADGTILEDFYVNNELTARKKTVFELQEIREEEQTI